MTGMMTFPQVVIDGEPIGGYQELVAADRAGGLAALADRRLKRRAARRGRGWQRSHTYVPRPAARSLRIGARSAGTARPRAGGSRKRSWKVPLTPSGSRKSSIVAPLASIPASSDSTTASRSACACARVSRFAGRSGWMRARNSASSA